jgi:hypothetical protein
MRSRFSRLERQLFSIRDNTQAHARGPNNFNIRQPLCANVLRIKVAYFLVFFVDSKDFSLEFVCGWGFWGK